MRNKIQRHTGTGTRHNTDPVQYKILLLTREPGQGLRRFLGRTQRDHVDIQAFFELRGRQRYATGLQELSLIVPACHNPGG